MIGLLRGVGAGWRQLKVRDLFGRVREHSRMGLSSRGQMAERQAGAIPFSVVGTKVAFLLVTTRRTGRWSFPKGVLVEGLPAWEVAAKEAYEEAGVEGRVEPRAIGTYRAWKTRGVRRSVIEVEMFPLRVTRQVEGWPEDGQRYRHWATAAEARRLLTDKRLVEFVEIINRRAD